MISAFQLFTHYLEIIDVRYQLDNQDKCYYNYLCSHPQVIKGIYFKDFNHFYSNLGYVMLGILFTVLVSLKHYALGEKGKPQHYGKCLVKVKFLTLSAS